MEKLILFLLILTALSPLSHSFSLSPSELDFEHQYDDQAQDRPSSRAENAESLSPSELDFEHQYDDQAQDRPSSRAENAESDEEMVKKLGSKNRRKPLDHVQDEVHGKVVDGIHRDKTVGEGMTVAFEHGGETIYYDGGKYYVFRERTKRVTWPFTWLFTRYRHHRKLHGDYIDSDSDRTKEGMQETAECCQNKAEPGKVRVEGVQDEVHGKVVDGIHRGKTVGEGMTVAFEHGGETIYSDGGKYYVFRERTKRFTWPFTRYRHHRKLHGDYLDSDSDRVPRHVRTFGNTTPFTSFYSGILGFMFLFLARRVWRNKRRTGTTGCDHHAVVPRASFTNVCAPICSSQNEPHEERRVGKIWNQSPGGKWTRTERPSQETLSELTTLAQDIALLHESKESLNTFTQNTVLAVILLALNEIAGYRSTLSFLYIFYIVGSLLTLFGGYSTEIGNKCRTVGQCMAWMVIGAACFLNVWGTMCYNYQ